MKRLMRKSGALHAGSLHVETDECSTNCVPTGYYSVPMGMIGEIKAWASRPVTQHTPSRDDPFPWPGGILMERGVIKDAMTGTDITEKYEKWCDRHHTFQHPEVLDIIRRWENK